MINQIVNSYFLMDDTELKLDEADKEADLSDVSYTHDEIFARVRARINAEEAIDLYISEHL
ncbi:MAG TPA: hypothetical protein VEG39_00600 [Clostridia bacterium]|nr:hypothetical protein [Clostridia bacterium]